MPAEPIGHLDQIKHIVVLMMENRSFDQMLGYLMRDGLPDLNGLTGDEFNLGPGGGKHPVHEYGLDETVFPDKNLDPCHSPHCVAEQLADDNGGFVKNFVATRKSPISDAQHGLVMGYYTARHLPAYDFLARNFCVCDAWHASIPGDTWPNRLYSLSGGEAKPVRPRFLEDAAHLLPILKKVENVPIYDVAAFTRHLDDRQWRWYSHDPATLRAADARYRSIWDLKHDNFCFFDRKKVSPATEAGEALLVAGDSFLDDAANGNLRDVSWIDPNFIDLSVLDPSSNDDHPPSDVRAGQALVLDLYEALRHSPNWDDTLLVVVYDEHGGFYDHVPPPPAPDGAYKTLGVRVPALVVGPRVPQMVCHDTFEHTTLIKTILTRFAANADQAAQQMGPRVAAAPHLGALLADAPRIDIPEPGEPRAAVSAWLAEAHNARLPSADAGTSAAPDGAGQPLELHEFQAEFASFAMAMRAAGLPHGQP